MSGDRELQKFYIEDQDDLLGQGSDNRVEQNGIHFIWDDMSYGLDLPAVGQSVSHTLLLRLSAQACLFTKEIINDLAKFL